MPTISQGLYRGNQCIVQDMSKFSLEGESSETWWADKTLLIKNWLKSNPLRIGIPDDGTEKTILDQIERGDLFPQTRAKCWSHIARELQDIPGVDQEMTAEVPPTEAEIPETANTPRSETSVELPGLKPPQLSPNRGKMRPGKQVLAESSVDGGGANKEEDDEQEEEEEEVVVVPSLPEKKKLSEMTMLERQSYWLQKKSEKANIEKQRQLEESEKELTFSPNLRRSSYSVKSRINASPPSSSKKAPLRRHQSYNERDDASTTSSSRPSSGGSERSVRTKKKKQLKKKGSLLDMIKSELKASRSPSPVEVIEPAEEVAAGEDEEEEEEEEEAVVVEEEEVEAIEPKPPTEDELQQEEEKEAQAFKFHAGSTETKGRYKVREAAHYELNSMYRKRDKYAGRDGIALQMGRHEETHIEEVVAVLFDLDKITQLEAGYWWVKNKHRFL